jgi:transporter family-2 protein
VPLLTRALIPWSIGALAFIVSMANALQARVNGAASDYIDHPVIAAMMSVGGGFLLSFAIALTRPESRRALRRFLAFPGYPALAKWQYFAGFGGGIFILGQALVVPGFGVSIYIIAVVAGQTLASLFVDHIGLGPAGKKPVTLLRISAAIFATIGVVISAFGRGELPTVAVAAVSFGLAAGAATALQYALNGRIAGATGSAMLTSALNFFMGFILLTMVLIITTVAGVWELTAPPSILERPELWLGGPLGMLFIASAAIFVRQLGVLLFAVVSVLGQLAGAILLDIFAPTPGAEINGLLAVGLVVTAVGVVAASVKRHR